MSNENANAFVEDWGTQFVALQLNKTVFTSAQAITVTALPLQRLVNIKLKWSKR